MTCRSVSDDAQSDLQPVAELLFKTSDDEDGLWHFYMCLNDYFNY